MKKKLITEALKNEGFGIEFQGREILVNRGYSVSSNLVLEHFSYHQENASTTEIDIFAQNCKSSLLIECKGGSSSGALVLIESPKEESNPFKNTYFKENNGYIFNVSQSSIEKSKVCFTGDFFAEHNGKFRKANKNQDSSNLYKGIKSLSKNMAAYLDKCREPNSEISTSSTLIFPMILTNVEIFAADYSNDVNNPEIRMREFCRLENTCLLEGNVDFCGGLQFKSDSKGIRSYPEIWICNLKSLNTFLDRIVNEMVKSSTQ